jgi:Fic family protein/DNA-binding XRE family transcriptional regulator
MKISQKLAILIKLSGLTQAELAQKIGVTFVALNRWVNDKSTPRAGALVKIDELYALYSGEKIIPDSVAKAKKAIILKKSTNYKNLARYILDNPDIFDVFLLSLTYNSNKIEGSTLTENETADIIFRNKVLKNKSLKEQLEVKNHQTALVYLFEYIADRKKIDENLILKMHGILMNSVKSDAGEYRTHNVRIMGTYVPTANYLKVPVLMKDLSKEILKNEKNYIEKVARIHSKFEQIHPFSDGNGRTGRLLMHAMALSKNISPVVIREEDRKIYMKYLNKSQMEDDMSGLVDFVCDAILDGFKIIERK